MIKEIAFYTLAFYWAWAVAGFFLGIYAQAKTRSRFKSGKISPEGRALWWTSLVTTPLAGGFAIWIGLSFVTGNKGSPGMLITIALITGAILAFPAAAHLFFEADRNGQNATP